MKKDPYKQYEEWHKREILIENKMWTLISKIELWDWYAKADIHKEAVLKVWQKKEWKRKERLI